MAQHLVVNQQLIRVVVDQQFQPWFSCRDVRLCAGLKKESVGKHVTLLQKIPYKFIYSRTSSATINPRTIFLDFAGAHALLSRSAFGAAFCEAFVQHLYPTLLKMVQEEQLEPIRQENQLLRQLTDALTAVGDLRVAIDTLKKNLVNTSDLMDGLLKENQDLKKEILEYSTET